MKKVFSKRLLAAVLALVVCVSVAGASMAVESSAQSTRLITVDTDTVLTEDFIGIGTNHWCSNFVSGMNAAYQTVNEERNAIQELKYVRLLFLPQWLMDQTLPAEQMKEEYENGIYHWENLNVVNFYEKIRMYHDIGATVIINVGGRATVETAWWQVEDAGVSEAGLRAAPADLQEFAEMTYALFEHAWDLGYDNVTHVSFFNEVNGGNYEAFANKKEYWVQMLSHVHNEFKKHTYTNNPQSPYYNMNARDVLNMLGTELSGFVNEPQIPEWLDYVKKNLVEEDGTPMFEILNAHQYPHYKTWEQATELYNKMGAKYPGIWANEFGPRALSRPGIELESNYNADYKFSETSQVIAMTNAGYGGIAQWMTSAEYVDFGFTFGVGMMGMWEFINKDIDDIRTIYGERGLYTHYIPKNCKTYKATVDADDLICAVYGKDGDISALLEVEKSSKSRELTIDFGPDMAGKTFRRHVHTYPEPNAEGLVDSAEKYEYGDLIPASDKEIVADGNGKITDILPVDVHCSVVYTTMEEEVQIVTDENLVKLSPTGTKDFNVTAIYGTDNDSDLSNVTWEIYGKSRSDTDGGYYWTTENAGTIDQNGTYNAAGTAVGDTISIKITSNYDPSAYTIIIVEIV